MRLTGDGHLAMDLKRELGDVKRGSEVVGTVELALAETIVFNYS